MSVISPQQQEETSTSHNSPRINSPPATQLRHRHFGRSTTNLDETVSSPLSPGRKLRRSSTFSDTVSEARHSIKSSTDDLFLPRVGSEKDFISPNNDSHWQSSPLALALLPALAGVLFQNGSAILTDITLLALAAVFLNWSIRLPWDWYHSSQQTVERKEPVTGYFDLQYITEEITENENTNSRDEVAVAEEKDGVKGATSTHTSQESNVYNKARHELHINELAALASCFLFPVVGTWLLHAIRSQLSRPSEGLVSNYNLTIFLLAAEIRPVSHLLKMVQTRTLHLQRVIESTKPQRNEKVLNSTKIADLSRRLEELESSMEQIIAQSIPEENTQGLIDTSSPKEKEPGQDIEHVISEVLKSIQPHTDTLSRATRKLEKRITVSSFDTETRLHSLETQLQELRSVIASTQRNMSRSLTSRLISIVKPVTLMPLHMLSTVVSSLARITMWPYRVLLGLAGRDKKSDRKQGGNSSKKSQRGRLPSPLHRSGSAIKRT